MLGHQTLEPSCGMTRGTGRGRSRRARRAQRIFLPVVDRAAYLAALCVRATASPADRRRRPLPGQTWSASMHGPVCLSFPPATAYKTPPRSLTRRTAPGGAGPACACARDAFCPIVVIHGAAINTLAALAVRLPSALCVDALDLVGDIAALRADCDGRQLGAHARSAAVAAAARRSCGRVGPR